MIRKIALIILYILSLYIVPVSIAATYKYLNLVEGDNDCMRDYVQNIMKEGSTNEGTLYKFQSGDYHIEYGNPYSIRQFTIGHSKGCYMESNTIMNSVNNTIYCSIVYTGETIKDFSK